MGLYTEHITTLLMWHRAALPGLTTREGPHTTSGSGDWQFLWQTTQLMSAQWHMGSDTNTYAPNPSTAPLLSHSGKSFKGSPSWKCRIICLIPWIADELGRVGSHRAQSSIQHYVLFIRCIILVHAHMHYKYMLSTITFQETELMHTDATC